MHLIELDVAGAVETLVALGHIDKQDFRDACTQWLCDAILWENGAPGCMIGSAAAYLAAPEPEHIVYTRGIELPYCEADTGERCDPECVCPLLWLIPDGRIEAVELTIWDIEAAWERGYRARRQSNNG